MGTGDAAGGPVRLRYAVVVTRDRPRDFADCVAAVAPQVDAVIPVFHVVGEAPDYIKEVANSFDIKEGRWIGDENFRVYDPDVLVMHPPYAAGYAFYHEDPPNISRMWNLGLSSVHEHAAGQPYDVAVLNDDAVVPPDWFQRVTGAMRREGAAAGAVRRERDPRMAGYAFVLDGEKGIRADERFRWWYGDDDIAMQAKGLGGVAFASGEDVEHRHPNSTTVGALAEAAAEDAVRFREKWF